MITFLLDARHPLSGTYTRYHARRVPILKYLNIALRGPSPRHAFAVNILSIINTQVYSLQGKVRDRIRISPLPRSAKAR
jgi:hypothetical protein